MNKPCKYNCGCCEQATGTDGLCDECRDQQWVLISEKLPEEDILCLVSVKGFSGNRYVLFSMYIGKFMSVTPQPREITVDIIAWMPLPFPIGEIK